MIVHSAFSIQRDSLPLQCFGVNYPEGIALCGTMRIDFTRPQQFPSQSYNSSQDANQALAPIGTGCSDHQKMSNICTIGIHVTNGLTFFYCCLQWRLSGVAGCLHTEHFILRDENSDWKWSLSECKKRMSGKWLVLKGKLIVSTEETQQKLAELERATKAKKKICKKTWVEETLDDGINDEDMKVTQMKKCIKVQLE